MRRILSAVILIVLLLLLVAGCGTPPVPPEVTQVENLEQDLGRDRAIIYASDEFTSLCKEHRGSKDRLIAEQSRLGWFRNYELVQNDYRYLLQRGLLLKQYIKDERDRRNKAVEMSLASHTKKTDALLTLASSINEGRIARRSLTRAELLIGEARVLLEKEKHKDALTLLDDAGYYLQSAERSLKLVVGRYTDSKQIAHWQRLVEGARRESKGSHSPHILVSKLDRKLIILKNGVDARIYRVGVGRNGLKDKIQSGDQATPEGRYKVIKKVPGSRFFRALLINYPNDEDLRAFSLAKKKGLVSKRAGIGNLLEIHGGGKDGVTDGCVALDNHDMAEIFEMANVGTPVTIVGSMSYDNIVSAAFRKL